MGMFICKKRQRTILICVCVRSKTGWKDHVYLGCTQRECQISKENVDNYRSMFESRIYSRAMEKYQKQKPRGNLMPKIYLHGLLTWKVMQRNEWKDIANLPIKPLSNYTKSQRHAWMIINSKKKKMKSVGELSTVCSQIVLKCLYLARIGRPDILWSVNKLARSITKWTSACDKRLARLISYIHHTSEFREYGYVGNTAQQCRMGLFQDSAFAGDLEDSKSTSGGILCIFGSRTFVPLSWMCKKQTSVSHSSTESEIISLDAGLRMDGIPALTLWDLVIEVSHSVPNRTDGPKRESHGETRRQLSSRTCITPSQSCAPTSFQQTLITFHPTQRILISVLFLCL